MQLRRPTDKLAGACWLPRFIDKARKFLAGELPKEYADGFCNPRALDGVFLSFFTLSKDKFLEVVRNSQGDDERIADWFRAQPAVTPEKIGNWNEEAPRIGAPGQRGHEIFRKLVTERYPTRLIPASNLSSKSSKPTNILPSDFRSFTASRE
jgi:hypothetical protein